MAARIPAPDDSEAGVAALVSQLQVIERKLLAMTTGPARRAPSLIQGRTQLLKHDCRADRQSTLRPLC